MATFYGADVEQLDYLASALESEGRALDGLLRRLDARLKSVHWQGPDAERSRSDWSSTVLPRGLHAVEGLMSTADIVRGNAAAQRDASGAGPWSGFNPGGLLPRFPDLVPFPMPPGFGPWRPNPPDWGFGFPRPVPFDPENFRPINLFPLDIVELPAMRLDPDSNQMVPWAMVTPSDLFRPTREVLESNIPGTLWSWGDVGGLVPGASDVLAVRDMADQMSQGQVPIHGMVDTAAGALRKAPHTYLAGVAAGTWNTTIEEFGKADFSAETRANTASFVANDPWGAATAASEAVVSFLPNLVQNFL